jgi:hypothetical protein
MFKRLLLAALVAAPTAQAGELARATAPNGSVVVLQDTACQAPAKGQRVILLRGDVQTFAGCWVRSEGLVEITWDDGDKSYVASTVFKR